MRICHCVISAILLAHLCSSVLSNADVRQPKGVIGQLNTLIVGPDHFEPHYITAATPAVTRTRQKVTSAPPPPTRRPAEEKKTDFSTKTIYGFLDFITTVGDTVMVFTPNSKTQASKRKASTTVQRPTASSVQQLSPSVVSSALQVVLTSAAPADFSPSTSQPVTAEVLFATPASLSLESSFENSFESAFGNVTPASSRWSQVRRRRPQTQRPRTRRPLPPAPRAPSTPEPSGQQRPLAPLRRHPTLVPILVEGSATPTVRLPPETRVSLGHNVGYRVRQRPNAQPASSTFRLEFPSEQPTSVVSESPATPSRGRLVLSSINVRPTGLVTTFGGTDIAGGLTTVHTTSVIGTYIRGQYAQVLQSSSTIFSSAPARLTVQPTLRQRSTLRGRPSVLAGEVRDAPTVPAEQRRPAPAPEPDVLPLERLFSALDGGDGEEAGFADLVAAGSRPSREVVVAPSRPARFTPSRGAPSRAAPSRGSHREATTLPPRRSYSSARKTNRGPSVAERRKQQLLQKRRQKLAEKEPTSRPQQRPRQKKAEPLARQQFGSRTAQPTERTSSLRYPSRETRPQYPDSITNPQAAGSVARPQYVDQGGRQPYQDTRQQYQDTLQQYQDTRQQYHDTRQQYSNIRQQYQEQTTRRPTQITRVRPTQPRRTRPTPRPRTRPTQPTRPPTTQPPRPPPTPAPRPQPQAQYLQDPSDDYYYYDYYDDVAPVEEAPIAPTAVAEHNDGGETEVLAVSTHQPEGATDFYHEITTLKTMRHITLGRYTNSQWVTQTKTRTVAVQPTAAPSPSQVTPATSTLAPSVLLVATTPAPEPVAENLLGPAIEAPVVMLPPVHLDPSSPSLPLHTMTETYSTTQLVLKSSVIPLVIADNTRSFTITQTYHVTRVVTALKTMPPVELFDDRAGLVSPDAPLEGPHSQQLAADGVPAQRLPEADSLAHVGGKFDPDVLEQSTHPEMLALHSSSQEKPAPAAITAVSPAASPAAVPPVTATPALPTLGGNTLSPLGQLGQLNQLAQLSQLAQLGQTSQLGALGQLSPQQLLYLQLLSPYLARANPAAAAAAAVPPAPRTIVSSSPVYVTTTVTNTNRRAVVVTFRATPSTAYITSTTVVATVLTSYVTSTVTMSPTQSPLFG